MAHLEAPVRAHLPKPSAGESARDPHPRSQARRCPGVAAQLAAVHRTLRHGPVLQLQAGGGQAAEAVRAPEESAAPAPSRAVEADAGPGAALLAMVEELEAAARTANGLAARSGDKPPSDELIGRLKALRGLAEGTNEPAKAEALAALRRELGRHIPAPAATEAAPAAVVQRVDAGVVAIGAALLAGIGYLANRTYAYVRRRRQEEREDAIGAAGTVSPIPAELKAGVAARPGHYGKAKKLFDNINAFRFRYTGFFMPPRVAFGARQGDCRTLVGMFQEVAHEMNIPFQVGFRDGRQLVAPLPIHGRDARSNTEEGSSWYFGEHYWAVGGGSDFDVLFMTTPPPAAIMSNGHAVHQGVTYYTFTDGRCVIEPGQDALDHEIQGEGRVFANQQAATDFIDDNI